MKNRHILKSFLLGFLTALRFQRNYYEKEVDKIQNKTIAQALKEDLKKVSKDFRNAIKRNS